MKSLLPLILGLGISLSAPSAALSEPEDDAVQQCLSSRIEQIGDAVTFIDEKATKLEGAVSSRPNAARILAKLRAQATITLEGVEAARTEPRTAAKLKADLQKISVNVSIMGSMVTRIKLSLMWSRDRAAKEVLADMTARLKALREQVPANDPARDCEREHAL